MTTALLLPARWSKGVVPPEAILAAVEEVGEVVLNIEKSGQQRHGTSSSVGRSCRCAPCTAYRETVLSRSVHGLYATYYKGCRCTECRQARTEVERTKRARALASGTFKHGGYGYDIGCRCDICWEAKAIRREKNKQHMAAARAKADQ